MSFRKNIKTIFNLIMSAILYAVSLLFYLYVCPLMGPINPAEHNELYHYLVGPLIGLIWMSIALFSIVVIGIITLLIGWGLQSLFGVLFDEIFPDKELTDEQKRDVKLEDALVKNPIKKFLNKIKRLR